MDQEDWKSGLDPAVRKALHEIRDLLQEKFLQVEMNTKEIEKIKETLAAQAESQETLKKIDAFMTELSVSLTWANRIRAIVLYLGAPIITCITAYKAWKGIQ